MPVERRGPNANDLPTTVGGKGEMIKAPISLQDLRRKIYLKAKADDRSHKPSGEVSRKARYGKTVRRV